VLTTPTLSLRPARTSPGRIVDRAIMAVMAGG
jgi:hypothetical protein